MLADFYLIDKPRFRSEPLRLVCELTRKALTQQLTLLILARDFAQAEAIDDLLWAFDADAFIPHQLAGGDDDDEVPVLVVPPGVQAPPRPLAINLRDEVPAVSCERVLEVVAADDAEREGSRRRWRAYREAGATLRKHDM